MKKKVYLEWMRIIACALVIFNHLAGYELYGASVGVKQAVYMTLTMITRINVPLFLMISGTLLLGKEEDFKTVFRKRVSRMALAILIFEGGLFLLHTVKAALAKTAYDHSVWRFVQGIFSGEIDGAWAYWYLYAYLGFLCMLPFMQRAAQKMEKQDFWVLLILHFVFSSFVPIVNLVLNAFHIGGIVTDGNFAVPFATEKAFFYPLLGYYLDRRVDVQRLRKKHVALLLAASCAGIAVSGVCTYYEGTATGVYTQNYVQLFDYVTTIAAFLLIKHFVTVTCPRLSKGAAAKVSVFAGSLTFGIYLLDPYWKVLFYDGYDRFAARYLPTILVSVGWILISMCLGGAVTWLLKKLPGFKKIV